MDTLSFMLGIGTVIFLLLVTGIVVALFKIRKLSKIVDDQLDNIEYLNRRLEEESAHSLRYTNDRMDNLEKYIKEEYTSLIDSRIDKLTDKLTNKQQVLKS